MAINPHYDYVKRSFIALALWFPIAALADFGGFTSLRTNSILGLKTGVAGSSDLDLRWYRSTFNLENGAKNDDRGATPAPDSTD